jgi:hypothetical protein
MCAMSLVFPFHLAALLSVYLSFLTPPSDNAGFLPLTQTN